MGIRNLLLRLAAPRSGTISSWAARGLERLAPRGSIEAIDALGIAQGDSVLDMGFGGGSAVVDMLERVGSGCMAGLEVSDTMVDRCRRIFAGSIEAGRLEIRQFSDGTIPWDDARFDRVASVNPIVFWHDPRRVLDEVLRVLRPGGTLVLHLAPGERVMEREALGSRVRFYDGPQTLDLISVAGFEQAEQVPTDGGSVVFRARRPRGRG